jgi:tetratricopeptide (TPR) repeat protein
MLEDSAAIAEDLGDKYLLTSALISLGIVDMSKGDYFTAQQRFERCLDVAREIRYPWGIADALTNLGCLYRIKGEYVNAQPFFDEALQVYQEHMRNVWGTDVLCAMTENALVQGDFPTAHLHLQAANSLLGSSENKWLQVLIRYFSGLLAYYEGNLEEAAVMLGETTVLARDGQFMPDLARSLVTLGRVRIKLGDIGLANDLIKEGLGLFRDFGHKLGIVNALEALADVCVVRGDTAHAVMLLSTGNALRQAIGAPLPPIDRPAYDSTILTCRTQLGDDVFSDLWDRAATKTYKEVVEETLKVDEAISGEVSENKSK